MAIDPIPTPAQLDSIQSEADQVKFETAHNSIVRDLQRSYVKGKELKGTLATAIANERIIQRLKESFRQKSWQIEFFLERDQRDGDFYRYSIKSYPMR